MITCMDRERVVCGALPILMKKKVMVKQRRSNEKGK
jgi:hypothetical protein